MASGGISQYPPQLTNDYSYVSIPSSGQSEAVVIPPIKSSLSEEYCAGLIQYAITPLAKLEIQTDSDQSTRIALLSEHAKFRGMTFTAAPFHSHEIYQGSKSVLDSVFTKLTAATDTEAPLEGIPILPLSGCYDEEQQILANSLLTSGHKNRCFLNMAQVQESISIQETKKSDSTPWPAAISANVTNVLILANQLNRNVIFFDPNRIDGQKFVLQQPELTCKVGTLEELLTQFPCFGYTPPILVTSDQSHLYLFQDREKTVRPTYHLRVKQFIDAIAQTAFSDCLGSLPERSLLPISHENYTARLRLVPTHEGFSLQSFQPNEFLYDEKDYLLYIFAISKQLALQNPDPVIYQSSRERTVFQTTRAADTEQYLITREQLSQLELNYQQWIEDVGRLRRYALKGITEDISELMTLSSVLERVQSTFSHSSGDLKESMFILLSHIPYNDRIKSLNHPDSCIVKWVLQLEPLVEKTFPQSTQPSLPRELYSSLSKCIGQFTKLKTVQEVSQNERMLKLIDTSILQLLNPVNKSRISAQDKNDYILPLFNQLKKLKTTPQQQTTEQCEFYPAIVTALAKEKQQGQTLVPLPTTSFATHAWIQQHYPLGSLTEKQQNMLLINYEVVFELLRVCPETYSRSLKNYLSTLQATARRHQQLNHLPDLPYNTEEIKLFPSYMKYLYDKVHPLKLISEDQQQKFSNLLPVLQQEMLSRLWSSHEEMQTDIKHALGAAARAAGFITDKKRPLNRWKKVAPEQPLVLSQSQLQTISGQLSIKLKSKGQMELRLNEQKCCELNPSFLVKLRTTIDRPAHHVLTDCFSDNPKAFNKTWAAIRTPSSQVKRGGWRV
ncbi:hypothetical protein D5018_14065 [Parashewanella curva]|uniref:Uncharacterized protein n=1 Tax=Parashewanella curva TaxID=2338552 RepID=A0A3L8PUI9_9GAMM|nr:hypothetical protein [Parashewanella curva]RLV59071.1 hypothetical protein D5018_14065 [Parashewanella curva]